MRYIQKNESVAICREVLVQMVSDADNLSPATGLTLTAEVVKAGGSAYAAIAGTCSEIGQGTYRVALVAADVDTEGPAMLRITATGARAQSVPLLIVRFLHDVHLVKAALANHRLHTIDTGVDTIKDDDGSSTLLTLTPSESDGVVTITPS